MNDAIIKTVDLRKVYEGRVRTEALRGISFEIERGKYICIAGPSGHGKSTLLHVVGALDRPTSGRVFLDGIDVTRLSDNRLADIRAKRIGFVFQFFNLIPNLTIVDNIELSLMFGGFPESKQEGRARELLTVLGLEDKLDATPSELSGGQQQRVAVARALANDPDILLMDEPTGNLDSASEAEVLKYIDVVHQRGKTIVIVTHSEKIAKRAEGVVYLEDGRIKGIV